MHDTWTERLSEYLDDELPPRERGALDAHLAACEACRRTLADLARIAEAARTLPNRPPAADLWSGIAARLTRAAPPAAAQSSARRISLTMPQLAAASLLLAAVSAGLAWRAHAPSPAAVVPAVARAAAPAADGDRPDPLAPPRQGPAATVSFADAQYDAAVADLERALQEGRSRLDPSTVAVVEQNLQIIDGAIAQAREALEADPANAYLNSHLLETRRKKLELLRRAAALTTGG